MDGRQLGRLVRQLREQQGLNEVQLADRAQVAVSFVTLLEAGQQAAPRVAILGRIARALGVDIKRLQ